MPVLRTRHILVNGLWAGIVLGLGVLTSPTKAALGTQAVRVLVMLAFGFGTLVAVMIAGGMLVFIACGFACSVSTGVGVSVEAAKIRGRPLISERVCKVRS